MSSPIGVGVVGVGRWGRNLVRNFAALGALAALCDSDPAALEDQGARHPRARRHRRMDDLLADPGVDAVAIVTPSPTHAPLARRALEAGKAVFVEKPLCLDLADAVALRDLATNRGLVLMVGHLLLFHPAFVALRARVEDGYLGDPRYIYSHRLTFRADTGADDAWWDLAPHDVAMILALAGGSPLRVSGGGTAAVHPQTVDTVVSQLEFPGGLAAHVFVSWVHPIKEQRLMVVGEGGTAVFDDVLTGAKKLMLYPHEVHWSGAQSRLERGEPVPIPYPAGEPLAQECRHFIDCVDSGRTPLADGDEGCRVLAVLQACLRARAEGAVVEMGAGRARAPRPVAI